MFFRRVPLLLGMHTAATMCAPPYRLCTSSMRMIMLLGGASEASTL